MWQFFLDFYGYAVFFYSLGLIISYVVLMILAYRGLFQSTDNMVDDYAYRVVERSPYTPGVSIVAPAYNEEKTVVDNIKSLLKQKYPKFEVVIVNDGSKDSTLETMITNFDMVPVDFAYVEYLQTKPFKRLYRSTNPLYEKLIVVDKENGGTKADPINTGINVASYDYFINTDVDCILTEDAIYQCMLPVMRHNNVIAVSGMMTMSNGCDIENGEIKKLAPPSDPIPLWQELEYLRSFFVGKMGWSAINAMSNVSGGFGLFDRRIVLKAGGYSADSFAEDMDVLLRMMGYCCENDIDYRVVQVSKICARTEGPGDVKNLKRQRTRWGRGLFQTFDRHFKKVANPTHRRVGLITLPYILVFEFMAPVIEIVGMITVVYLAFTGGVNWPSAVVIFSAIYIFGFMLSLVTLLYAYKSKTTYTKLSHYLRLAVAALLEPVLYHPLLTFFSINGYINYLRGTKAVWVAIARKGYASKTGENPAPPTAGAEKVSGGIDNVVDETVEPLAEPTSPTANA